MAISINGTTTDLDATGKNLGDILTILDERAERAGQVIIAISLNGQSLGADELPANAAQILSATDSLELQTTAVRFMRIDAIRILLGLCDCALHPEGSGFADRLPEDARDYALRYSGLLSAEENSFVDSLIQVLAQANQAPDAAHQESLSRICSFFTERLAEAEDPLRAMTATAKLFAALEPDLSQVSVRLQTGKDAEAMHTMVLVVEIINKTVRLLPDFIGCIETELLIEDRSVQDFYDDFNTVLQELMEAFEHKDSILIGDLAEYEIRPRMGIFFRAVTALLDGEAR